MFAMGAETMVEPGARAETPAQAPVASLNQGLARLRALGWEWPAYPDRRTFRRVLAYLLAVPVIVLCIIVAFTIPLYGSIFPCLAVGIGIFWLVLAGFTFELHRLTKMTKGMAMRAVNPELSADLPLEIKKECAPLGGGTWEPWAHFDSPLAFGFLDREHWEFKLESLGVSVIVGLKDYWGAKKRPYILFIGPVTGENIGGIVRLAEALDRYPSVGSARPRHR